MNRFNNETVKKTNMKTPLLLLLLLIFQSGMLLSCKKESAKPAVVPEIIISDVSIPEGNTSGQKAVINVDLSEVTTVEVSFTWSTEDGTAKAGQDYVASSGNMVTFAPGELSKTIEVPLISDNILEFTETFHVKISNILNATAAKTDAIVKIQNDDTYTAEVTADGYITPASYPGMSLVWSDEFDSTALNTSNWNYELGGGGWGNSELEIYTSQNENSFVKDGYLTIQALKNQYNNNYTSARLTTKGKKEFTYGRIDIRAKMPIGQGIWPALWMLGGNISSVGWPACGEIDIMEYLGNDTKTVYGTAHYNDGGHKYKGSNYQVSAAENYHDKFHVFTIIWQEGSMEWFVDYHRYFMVTPFTVSYDAFNLPQFFIFNVAVGGAWPGNPNSSTTFPQSMIVDYVRVFQ
ncbi:MAG: family 16 glycosylhydrolase [Bacteroidetes bacterium]|nr:family 16 glycosylhydrolase [Bacteroidota bacterium]